MSDLVAKFKAWEDDETAGYAALIELAYEMAAALLRERDESRADLIEEKRMVSDHKQCADGYFDALIAARAALAEEQADLGRETTEWQQTCERITRQRDAARALLLDGAVLMRGYGNGVYPDYPEGLLVAIDAWLARLDAALGGSHD